ncbi:phage tail protein [Vibrio cholerae]
MENIQEYGLDFVFNSRKALQKINEFERTVNKKIQRINTQHVKAEKEKTKATVTQGNKRLSSEEKLAQKELKLKQRQEEVLRKKQIRFEAWKTQQLRSASMDRLTLEQKMQVKHLLSAKKTEEEIREEYKKTTALMQRENRRRAKMNKNKSGGLGGGGSKVSAALGGLGIGGVIGAGLNPLTAAAAAAAAALMSVASGARDYKDLRAGADRAGVSVDYLNRMDFITQGIGQGEEFNRDKLADMLSDFDERRGELTRDLDVNTKGEFVGGEGADLANALKDAGLVKTVDDVKKFVSGSTEEVFGRVLDTTAEMQKQGKITDSEARFILESFTSDLGKLGNAYNKNSEQVAQLEQDYAKLGNTITDAQQQKMNAVGSTFAYIGAVFDKFNLNVFKSFSEMLSTTALEGFSEMAAVISRLAPVIGKIVGLVGNFVGILFKGLAPVLDIVMDALTLLVDGLTSVANTIIDWVLAPIANAVNQVFKTVESLLNGIFSFIDGLIKRATSLLPSWMGGSTEATGGSSTEATNTNTNTSTVTPYNMRQAVPSYNTGYGYNVPSYTPPDAKVSVARIEESKQQQVVPVNITVEANREGLAAYVAQSSTFNNSVAQAVYPLWAN